MMEQQTENSTEMNQDATAPAAQQPGELLREARERLGLSVADAADQTKLAPRQIEALEAGDYGSLPEMAFVRGFVRSYAKILNLDAQPLLALLPQAIVSGAAQVTRASVEVPFPDAHSPRTQNLVWLGAALFLSVLVVVFAVWHYTSPRTPAQPEQTHPVEMAITLPAEARILATSEVAEASAVAAAEVSAPAAPATIATAAQPAPETRPVQPAPAAIVAAKPAQPAAASAVKATQPVPATKPAAPVAAVKPPVAAPAVPPAAKVAPASSVVRLVFVEEAWAEVRDATGNVVASQINPAGSELSLKGQGPFSLVVGHASTSQLFHKGKRVDLMPYTRGNSDVARLTLE